MYPTFILSSVACNLDNSIIIAPVNLNQRYYFDKDTYRHDVTKLTFNDKAYEEYINGSINYHSINSFHDTSIVSSTGYFTIVFNPIDVTGYYESEEDRDADYEKITKLVLTKLNSIPAPIKL